MLASLAYGLRRLGVVGRIAGASLVVLGIAWALLQGRPMAHAVAVFLYIGAGVTAVGATSGGGGARGRRMASFGDHRRIDAQMGDNVWFVLLALLFAGAGVVVQQLF